MRAIAVLSVIVYHVHEPWLPGGYLGVDLFFVLSGFLITSLLVIEHRKTDGIRLRNFWSRRARRLLPAVLVLIVVVAFVEHQTVQEIAVRATRRAELLATLFYVANWFFILSGSSYFAGYAGASPVRHTWSLAIEEQFYLFFPFLMAGGLKLRRGRLISVMVVVMGVSGLLMAGLFDPTDPTRSYYGTDARIHQMLAGGILALVLAGRFRDVVIRWARRFLPVSVALLALAFLFLQDDGAFYYRGGAFAIGIVAAALIAALEKPAILGEALSVRPLVGIGKISYGMYLWHFPIVVWLVRFQSLPPLVLLVVTLALTFLVSVVSYFLIERPIRVDRRIFGLELTPRNLAFAVPVASIAVAGLVVVALPDKMPEWAQATAQNDELVVREAVPTTSEPSAAEGAPETTEVLHEPNSVAIVGDSFMVSALPGFRKILDEEGVTLVEAAFAACPVGYEPLAGYDGEIHFKAEECASSTATAYQWLIDNPVDVVLWHDLQSVLPRFNDRGEVLDPGSSQWTSDLVEEWSAVAGQFADQQMEVIILVPPLRSQEAACASAESEKRCNDIRSQDATIRAATDAFKLSSEGVAGLHFLELDDLLCPVGIPCPTEIDGIAVREGGTDQTHFTEQGAEWFATKMVSRIVQLLNA